MSNPLSTQTNPNLNSNGNLEKPINSNNTDNLEDVHLTMAIPKSIILFGDKNVASPNPVIIAPIVMKNNDLSHLKICLFFICIKLFLFFLIHRA